MEPRRAPGWTRRRFLAASAGVVAAGVVPVHMATAQSPLPLPSPAVSATSPGRRTLYRGAALADGRSARLRRDISVLVDDGVIAGSGPATTRARPARGADLEVIDASGATVVPGLVDSHGHITMPGGVRWTDRGLDPAERPLAAAEHNGRRRQSAASDGSATSARHAARTRPVAASAPSVSWCATRGRRVARCPTSERPARG